MSTRTGISREIWGIRGAILLATTYWCSLVPAPIAIGRSGPRCSNAADSPVQPDHAEQHTPGQACAGKPVAVFEIPTAAMRSSRGSARRTFLARRGPCCTMRPSLSIQAEKPVLAAINNGFRHSTARNTPHIRCMSNSLEPQNQPSLVRFTRMSGSSPFGRQRVDLAANHMRQHAFVADVRRDANARRSVECRRLDRRPWR